ncbi:MAG: hypothetical protein COU09_02830 [Candidatus Harrisonbacteria bacterium CG10_big_fil_rev_8_21_14_0_10_44_23]|uniref:TIGR00341 family protein n=1 Tax=Candidatus Harrisonbacteria bacterium CG10_big_fil_rev_8_21_14_0_10_44_23 TaxID=1974585 RepID=A0A2H0URE7_9BACT|nr:MAG: hypothetical protein COU09_02830 [Candidatus Harrisonbacteria bacterium CG10_big_fil_rev_8_21_14_0_10_44_23]
MEEVGKITAQDRYRTVEELIARSQPSFNYYLLLVISSLIVASGLLLNNSAIVIGGMIVTPLLTPVLSIALGVIVGRGFLLKRQGFFLLKSFLIVVATGMLLTFLFSEPTDPFIFENTVRAAILYFIVAIASGAGATFAFINKDISDILPGIAVAVSVVPPLSLIGLGLASGSFELAQFYFVVFALNTIGIILGGMVVLSSQKFYRAEKKVDEQIKEIKKEDKKKEDEKIAKEEKLINL